VGKAQEGKPTTSRKGVSQSSPASAKDAAKTPTPSILEERMEVEPLQQRETEKGAGEMPADCSPLINVESTPIEVATEEPYGRN